MYYQIYVWVDTDKYACLSTQKKNLYCFLSVKNTTIFSRGLTEHRLSFKTMKDVFNFRDDCLPKHQGLYIRFNLLLSWTQNIHHYLYS